MQEFIAIILILHARIPWIETIGSVREEMNVLRLVNALIFAPVKSLSHARGKQSVHALYNTVSPTDAPSFTTFAPSASPSLSPSAPPSASPTITPSLSPSASPSFFPSASPSLFPSVSPSAPPSMATSSPTLHTALPTVSPIAHFPTSSAPTKSPKEGKEHENCHTTTINEEGPVYISSARIRSTVYTLFFFLFYFFLFLYTFVLIT